MTKDNIRNRVYEFGQRLEDKARDEYYATPEARLNTVIGGDAAYYIRLRKAKEEWDQHWKGGMRDHNFPQYLSETYGIKMKYEDQGLGLTYEIVDEQKHTLFLLKFGA